MAHDRAARTRRQLVHGGLALTGLALLSGCGLASLPRTEPKRAARVGFLDSSSAQVTGPYLDEFRQGMRVQGYEESRDYLLESATPRGGRSCSPAWRPSWSAVPSTCFSPAAA
jgi:hypothetical protein